MEFNETLLRVQGTLCSLGRRGLLNEKGSWTVVVNELKNITEGASDGAKSEIVFFMILNTNLSTCGDLGDDKYVGHFTNVFEFYIDKNDLIRYLYYLNLQESLFKVVENCPGVLGIELMDVIIKNLKDPAFSLDLDFKHFYQVWKSLFVKICKISIRKLNEDGSKFMSYFFSIYNLILSTIITSMSVEGSESFVGCHLYEFFKTFLSFLEIYKSDSLPDDPLYKLSIEFEIDKVYTVEDLRHECINTVLGGLPKILEKFTLQLWMSLYECYFDFDSKNSMQLLIGYEVTNVIDKIKELNISTGCLDSLANFAIDKFAIAELDEVIFNVRNGEEEWFKALIEHPSAAEEKSVECLLEMINLAKLEDLHRILNMSYEYICKEGNESFELMKVLFLTAMKKTDNYSEWIEKIFQNYRPGLLTTSHIQDELVKTFNKISKEKNVPTKELVVLCVQSPIETIKKICGVGIYGSLPPEEVIEVLKVLRCPCSAPHCDDYTSLDHVILNSILSEDLTNKENCALVDLIVRLARENLLGSFFPKLLMNALKRHLETPNLEKAVLCLKIIETSVQFKLFAVDEVVLLVFLSQVLGHFAWDLESFQTIKADGRELVISIVNSIINRMEDVEDGSKQEWARMEILKSSEVNRACFCRLWFRAGQNWPSSKKVCSCVLTLAHDDRKAKDLEKFLGGIDQSLEKKASIVLSLTALLPVLTFREWNSISDSLITAWGNVFSEKKDIEILHDILEMFGSFLYLLTLNLKTKEAYPCYEYCLRNFGKLAKRCCGKMSAEFLVKTVQRIAFVLGAIEDEVEKKCCWMLVTPVLLECVDLLKKKNAADDYRKEIEELLATSDVKDLAQTVAKRLAWKVDISGPGSE